MAENPYVNKVEYAGQTLIDVTDTTATEDDVAEGKAFTLASGAKGIGSLRLGNTRVWVGTCDTAAATRDKAVTITGVTEYKTGDVFVITFVNAQDYNGGPRLNVNGLGVKSIRRVSGSNAARYQWLAGETLAMVYNGTYMLLLNNGIATTTYYGLTKLSASVTSTSGSLAATAGAVNSALNMLTAMPPYSAEQTYSIGDRVRYSTGMYECNTDIATAEAWNADHWTQLPALQTQIDSIKNGITQQIGTLRFKLIQGVYFTFPTDALFSNPVSIASLDPDLENALFMSSFAITGGSPTIVVRNQTKTDIFLQTFYQMPYTTVNIFFVY